MATTLPTLDFLNTTPYSTQTINGIKYSPIIDRTTGQATWAQSSNPSAPGYYTTTALNSGASFFNSVQPVAKSLGVDPYTATKASSGLNTLTTTIQKGLTASPSGTVATFAPPALAPVTPVAPTTPATLQYTNVTNIDPTSGKTYTTQYQTTDPYSANYIKPADLTVVQQQAAANQTAYQQQQAQAATQAQQLAAAQAASQALAQKQATQQTTAAQQNAATTASNLATSQQAQQAQVANTAQLQQQAQQAAVANQALAAQQAQQAQAKQAADAATTAANLAASQQAQQAAAADTAQLQQAAAAKAAAAQAAAANGPVAPTSAYQSQVPTTTLNGITYYTVTNADGSTQQVQSTDKTASGYVDGGQLNILIGNSANNVASKPNPALQYTTINTVDAQGNPITQQVQTTDPNSYGYQTPAGLANLQYAAQQSSAQNQQQQATLTQMAQAKQAQTAQQAALQAQEQQLINQGLDIVNSPNPDLGWVVYMPNPDPGNGDIIGTTINGQNMIQTVDASLPGYVPQGTLDMINLAQANAYHPDTSGSDGFSLNSIVSGIGNALNSVGGAITKAGAQIGSFVDNHIPGGWATVGAAALLAVGITNPNLLGLADSGSLSATDLTSAGIDPATVSTNIANGVTDGTIAPNSVGLSSAPTIGADGSITTTAVDGAATTTGTSGAVTTTTVDGATTATTASGTTGTTTAVAPSETVGLSTNQVGALAPDTTGAATGGASTGAGGATTAATSTGAGSSINPITNYVNTLGLGPVSSGALAGAGTTAAIDVLTGKPITARGLLTGAATGGVAGEIGTFLPAAGTSALQAGINGAVTAAGANAIVDVVTGQKITPTNLATQALIGGAIGAGATAITNSGGVNTTYTWDDGSQMTTNSSGTPVSVTNSSGAVLKLGTQVGATGPVVDNSTGQAIQTPTTSGPITPTPSPTDTSGTTAPTTSGPITPTPSPTDTSGTTESTTPGPVAPTTVPTNEIPATTATTPAGTVDNGNGTSTTTYEDGSSITTNNTTGNPTNVVDNTGTTTLNTGTNTVPTNEIPATTATTPAGTVDNGNGTSTQIYDDGSTLTTNNTTGEVINTTNSTDTGGVTNSLTNNQTSAISGAGATVAGVATTTNNTKTPTGNQFLPIPTFTGQALTNPGINPGFIEPTPAYGAQPAGIDQYYWGQQGINAPAAPATPYGQTTNLGHLITPQQLGYPTQQIMNAYGLNYNPQVGTLQRDVYNNPVQMNTAAPTIAGIPQSYGPVTPTQATSGVGPGALAGQNLNYTHAPAHLTGTPSAGMVAPGTFTAISPADLAAQLQAQATSAGLATQGTNSG